MLETRNPAGIFWLPGYGYDTENEARDLHVVGTSAYVADHDSLQIFDVSHLPGITRWTRFTNVNADVVRVAGTRAFVGQYRKVSVVDVSTPTAPRVIGEVQGLGIQTRHLQVEGDRVYAAQDYAGWVFLRHRERTFQTLSLAVPSLLAVTNAPIQLEGTASSGLPVTWSVVSGPGRVNGRELTWTGPGTILVRADQAGSETVFPARVEKTITVFRLPQTLSFDPVNPALPKLNEGIQITARASSGLPVTIELVSGPAHWQENRLVMTNRGAVTVRAMQSGNDLFEPTSRQQVLYPVVSQPSRLGEWPGRQEAFPEDVAISGTRAVLACGQEGLAVVQISNPTRPLWLGVQEFDGRMTKVAVDGTLALVAVADLLNHYRLEIIDTSDPTRMVSLAKYPCPDYVGRIRVAGSKAYIACASQGLLILDISHPSAPVRVGSYEWFDGSVSDIEVRGPLAYCGMSNGKLEVLNISDPSHVVRLGSVASIGAVSSLHLVGTNVFAVTRTASGYNSLTVFDVSIHASPRIQGTTFLSMLPLSGVQVAGSTAFVSQSQNGLMTVDVSNLNNPRQTGTITNFGSAKSLLISDQTLYWPSTDLGFQILDVSNPAQVRRLNGEETVGFAYGVCVVGNRAYLAHGTSGYLINPLMAVDPRFEARPQPFSGTALAAQGNLLYLGGWNRFEVLDASNPLHLKSLSLLIMPESNVEVTAIQLAGNLAYLSCGKAGVRVLDISDPRQVVSIQSIPTDDARGLQVVGQTAYVADGKYGLRVLQLDAAKYRQEIAFPEPISPQPPDSTVTLQAAASSGLPIHYRVLAGPAVVTNSQELLLTGSGLIYVQAQQEGDDTFLPAESVTISVAAAARDPLPDLMAQWIQVNYPSIPASGRGLRDDPDADGASNGMEWLLGTDPSIAEPAAGRLPTGKIIRDAEGTAVWTWRFTLGRGVAEDTPWMLEHASNLAGTDWSAVPAEWLVRNGREVQVVMPVNTTSRFVRLRLGW